MTRRVVILEPDLDGHHAFWLAMLIEGHRQAGWAAEVITAGDVSRLRKQAESRGYPLSEARLHVARQGGDFELLAQAREVARETGATRVFVAFLDRFWPAVLKERSAGRGQSGVPFDGIWFHPYALDAHWRWAPPLDRRWKLRGRVHRFVRSDEIQRVLGRVFFLAEDPLRRCRQLAPGIDARLLPDPCERVPSLDKARARRLLGLPLERTIFLHLGSPEPRKGLPDLVEAFERLKKGLPRPVLLRVGENKRLPGATSDGLRRLAERGEAIVVDGFVDAEKVMHYFSACDWVTLPYRKFRYSSGILANAIGARRPVIASAHGEIGAKVAAGRLGLLYRHGSARALAECMETALANPAEPLAETALGGIMAEDFVRAVADAASVPA